MNAQKSTDKVTEHRITFGNLERAFLDEQKEQAKINSIIKGVGSIAPSLGIIAVGGGVCVAAYALYRWVGMSGNPVDAIVNAGTTLGEKVLGTTVEEQVAEHIDPIQNEMMLVKKNCDEKIAEQEAIISNPNSTANQKAMAELEITRIVKKCKQRMEYLRRKFKLMMDNPAYVALAGTWAVDEVNF